MWTAAHGQIRTLDNLMLHGCILANHCCMCCSNEESVDHLLISCPVAHSLQMYMPRLFGINWVMPGSVADLFFCWHHWLRKHNFDIWNLVLGCLMWNIWTKRNQRSFEETEKSLDQLLELCRRTLFDQFRSWGLSDCSTITDFLLSLNIAQCLFAFFLHLSSSCSLS